jgi:hypothetical protein
MNLRLAILSLACLALCGCPQKKAPVVNHPAGSAQAQEQADCHPGIIPATVKDVEFYQPSLPWWETHQADCPANMRKVVPSDREMERGYKSIDAPDFNEEEAMNWRVRHTLCEPDGLGEAKP